MPEVAFVEFPPKKSVQTVNLSRLLEGVLWLTVLVE